LFNVIFNELFLHLSKKTTKTVVRRAVVVSCCSCPGCSYSPSSSSSMLRMSSLT